VKWIRRSVAIADDPRIGALASALKRDVAHVVGLVTCVECKLPHHAPDGNIAAIPPATLEQWALWTGKRGAFDQAFRAHYCLDGVVANWDEDNGAPMRESQAAAERMRNLRRTRAERSPEPDANGSPQRSQNGSPDVRRTFTSNETRRNETHETTDTTPKASSNSGASGQRRDAPAAPQRSGASKPERITLADVHRVAPGAA
jgi:hypothetical protein